MRFVLAAAVAFLLLAPERCRADELAFKVPAGWAELTATGFAPDVAKTLSPEARAMTRPPGCVFSAFDLEHSTAAFTTNVNVVLTPGSALVTDAFLEEMIASLPKDGATFLEKKVLDVHGVPVGKVTTDRMVGTVKVRQVAYLLPGAKNMAVLTCSTLPDEFERYEPVFEDAARATSGLVVAASPSGLFTGVGSSIVIGAVVGGFLGLFKVLGKKSESRAS